MNPLWQLTLARIREFYREPAALFWVYGFPLLIAIALGIAFRDRPVERLPVELVAEAASAGQLDKIREELSADGRLEVRPALDGDWKKRLRNGKTELVILLNAAPNGGVAYEIWEERNRPESVLARNAVENIILKAEAVNPTTIVDNQLQERGSRYIDFLIPGLLGMNLMGGGLFGVGFVIVDMRVRKLLKRFLATPMRRSDFMLSIMISRLLFLVPEVLLLLTFAWLAFDVTVQGSLLALVFLIMLGSCCFAGIGLLVACRAKTIETVSGLMNLVMLPMYVVSGVFFSSERFPQAIQPLIQALPLTALNESMRAVMLEGQSLSAVWPQIAILIGWGLFSFVIALRYFRWK